METMETPAWVADLFRAFDAKDADKFAAFVAEDVFYRVGSAEPLRGRAAVRESIVSFFPTERRVTIRNPSSFKIFYDDKVIFK